jgi:hypothetical protein
MVLQALIKSMGMYMRMPHVHALHAWASIEWGTCACMRRGHAEHGLQPIDGMPHTHDACACMHACMCVCAHACMCACVCACDCVYVGVGSVASSIDGLVHMHVYACVRMWYACMHVCVCVMCVCTCACMYVCMPCV